MVYKNNGYAMVIVLVVITVLFLLSASLSVLISGEISLSSNNFKRINAKYNAETGIEEAIIEINTNKFNLKNPINDDPYESDTNWGQGNYEYYIYEPGFDINNDPNNYLIRSYGYYKDKDEVEKEIKVYVTPPEDGEDKTIIAGEDFLKDSFEIDPDDYLENVGSDNINDLFNLTYEKFYLPLNDPNIVNPAFYDKVFNVNSITADGVEQLLEFGFKNNQNQLTDSYSWETNGSIVFSEYEGYEKGYTIYSDSSFEISFSGNEELSTNVSTDDELVLPTVILVDGDLTLNKISRIENIILIVNGKITYNAPNTDVNILSSFIYAADGMFIQKDNEEPIGKLFNFEGQLISKQNVNIYTKSDSEGSYDSSIYNPIKNLDGYYITNVPPKIVRWEE